MSAEWPELFVTLTNNNISDLLNDRSEYTAQELQNCGYVAIATELNQRPVDASLVRHKEMYLENFFRFKRIRERVFGIVKPVTNLTNALLGCIYKTDQSFFKSFADFIVRYIRHLFVDLMTFIVLPICLGYDLLIYKLYKKSIQPYEWTPDYIVSGLIFLIIDMVSMPIILGSEFIRHALSLMISIVMLCFSWVIFPTGYAVSCFFNADPPAAFLDISKKEINLLLDAATNDKVDFIRMVHETASIDQKKRVIKDVEKEQANEQSSEIGLFISTKVEGKQNDQFISAKKAYLADDPKEFIVETNKSEEWITCRNKILRKASFLNNGTFCEMNRLLTECDFLKSVSNS